MVFVPPCTAPCVLIVLALNLHSGRVCLTSHSSARSRPGSVWSLHQAGGLSTGHCFLVQVCVDIFAFSLQPVDLASLAAIPRFTCGDVNYYPGEWQGQARHLPRPGLAWLGDFVWLGYSCRVCSWSWGILSQIFKPKTLAGRAAGLAITCQGPGHTKQAHHQPFCTYSKHTISPCASCV